MRGLTDKEREHVELAMGPLAKHWGDCPEYDPRDESVVNDLITRGLIIWVPRRDETGQEWDETYATSLGRLAFQCDTFARGSTSRGW